MFGYIRNNIPSALGALSQRVKHRIRKFDRARFAFLKGGVGLIKATVGVSDRRECWFKFLKFTTHKIVLKHLSRME